jgi:NDP-sugar pyrophosphorylase family protein
MNIIIPTLGGNNNFKIPRYLIKINNKYIIQNIIQNLKFRGTFIFIISFNDKIKFKADKILRKIKPNCKIIVTKKKTKGILQTLLLAKTYINNKKLIVSNCDHFINLDKKKFLIIKKNNKNFGCIFTYLPKTKNHCFLKYNGKRVEFAAERKKVSDVAAAGVYYVKNGSYFKKCIRKVIKNKITYNKMYYISSVYNEMIRNQKKIIHTKLKTMVPLGSPFELRKFIKDKNLKKTDFSNLF